jgi:hypothetical protein
MELVYILVNIFVSRKQSFNSQQDWTFMGRVHSLFPRGTHFCRDNSANTPLADRTSLFALFPLDVASIDSTSLLLPQLIIPYLTLEIGEVICFARRGRRDFSNYYSVISGEFRSPPSDTVEQEYNT